MASSRSLRLAIECRIPRRSRVSRTSWTRGLSRTDGSSSRMPSQMVLSRSHTTHFTVGSAMSLSGVRLSGVLEEAAAAFSAEIAGVDHLLQQRARAVLRILVFLEQDHDGVENGIQSDQIG